MPPEDNTFPIRKTTIEHIEEAIVGFLKDGGLSAKYLIATFPDDPDKFDLGDAEKVALVQYAGSRYAAPEVLGGAQQRSAEFAIHLYLRSVGQPLRAPYEIEQIRLAVQDQATQGVRLHVLRDGLIDQTEQLWRYLIQVATTPFPAVPLRRPRPTPMMSDFSKAGGA